MRVSHRLGRSVALVLVLSAACGRSSGCSSCDRDGAPFPNKDRVHSAVQVRVSDQGVAFLERNLETLLAAAVPDGLDVCIPEGGGEIIPGVFDWGYCTQECANGETGCDVRLDIGLVDLQMVEPDRVRASIIFDDIDARFNIDVQPVVDCSVLVRGPGFPVRIDLELSTPEPTRDLTFSISEPTYLLPALDITLEGSGQGVLDPLCDAVSAVINLPVIGDLIFMAIQLFADGFVVDLANGMIEDFTCRTCDAERPCPVEGGTQCVDGRCISAAGCVPQPLGIEGEIDLADLVGDYLDHRSAVLGYLATPGSYVQVEGQGLSLGIISGAQSERNRCVPPRPQPPIVEPPRAEALRLNHTPTGEPFEVGIAITQEIVDHFLWATYNCGTLCLSVDSEGMEMLNSRNLGLLVPGLNALTGGEAPIAVTVSPQDIPDAMFGANRIVPDPDNEGQMMLDEPAINLVVADLWLDFHVFLDDRWTRILSLGMDLEVGVGLSFTPENTVIVVLGDLSEGITNVRVVNAEILNGDPRRLEGLIPVLIGSLLPALTEQLLEPIEMPDVMGYRLDLQDHSVGGIEQNRYLAIFTNLERVEDGAAGPGARASVDTGAELLELHVPATSEFEIDGRETWKRPYARIGVNAWDGSRDDPAMEFSWRVDRGSWSLFTPFRNLVVRDPALLLQGRHTLQVRARRIDDYRTLDPRPAELELIIDSVSPAVRIAQSEAGAARLLIEASDTVSPAERLKYEARFDAGPWLLLDGPFVEPARARRVTVRVTDEAGNSTQAAVQIDQKHLIGRPPLDERTGGGESGGPGCSVNRTGSVPWSTLALGLLPLIGLALLRRRSAHGRRAGLAGLMIAMTSMGLWACNDSSGSKDEDRDGGSVGRDVGSGGLRDGGPVCRTDDDCPGPDQVCQQIDGQAVCTALNCAEGPSPCERLGCRDGDHGICGDNGVCECESFCPDGCPDGEFCCMLRNRCELPPLACADAECEPGYALAVVGEGTVDPVSCERTDAACDCVPAEPLDVGEVGRHSDFVVANGEAFFSAYSDDYGDLVVGHFRPGRGFKWFWIDGVPADGEVVGGISGPRGGVAEPGDDVGHYTAIASGPEGQLHVAYYDATHRVLKYAVGQPDGPGPDERPRFQWATLTLDDQGDAGRWASISVDPRGVPGVAYRVGRLWVNEEWVSEVRYRLAKNAAPQNDGDWHPPMVLHTRALPGPCGSGCTSDQRCVAETNQCGEQTGNCGECPQGQACVDGACAAVVESPPPPVDYPEGTGLFTAQIRGVEGLPLVAWYDRTVGSLWMTHMEEHGFVVPMQLAGWGHSVRDGDMGTNVDLALDGNGRIHFCYQDGMTDSLRYLVPEVEIGDGEIDEWVDDGIREQTDGRPYAIHVVGEDCNVGLDAAGDPFIVYQDATAHQVVLARRKLDADGAAEWQREILRGGGVQFDGSHGFYTRARRVDATLWVSSYMRNNQAQPIESGLDVFTVDLP